MGKRYREDPGCSFWSDVREDATKDKVDVIQVAYYRLQMDANSGMIYEGKFGGDESLKEACERHRFMSQEEASLKNKRAKSADSMEKFLQSIEPDFPSSTFPDDGGSSASSSRRDSLGLT